MAAERALLVAAGGGIGAMAMGAAAVQAGEAARAPTVYFGGPVQSAVIGWPDAPGGILEYTGGRPPTREEIANFREITREELGQAQRARTIRRPDGSWTID